MGSHSFYIRYRLGILRKRACQKFPKSRQSRESIYSHFRSSKHVERALFQAGNRQLSQTFPEKVYSTQVAKNWE